MAVIRIDDRELSRLAEGLSVRKTREATKSTYAAMGAKWHADFLPLHFEPFSASKYRYQPRTPRYLTRKATKAQRDPRIKKGGKVANVYTGLLEESMKRFADIKAYPSRVSVRMRGPRYITMRRYQSNQPDKAAEILTIIDSERRTLIKVGQETLRARLQQHLN